MKMGVISRFLGVVPKEERRGIRLEEAEPWTVSPTKDVERFLRALPLLVPEGSIVYFEGTGEPHVREYLGRISIPAQAQVELGTIWPRPDTYHVAVSQDSMDALATFLEKEPAGFFCAHCHVYRDGAILVAWHDAFFDDPMYVSRAISEDRVREFADRLGGSLSSGR